MVKRTPKSQKLYRWRITRIRASPAALNGYVEAPDQEQVEWRKLGWHFRFCMITARAIEGEYLG